MAGQRGDERAYRLAEGVAPPKDRATLLVGSLGCYDMIGEPDMSHDLDFTLHERSKFEFVREQLTDAQRAELDQVDAFWRANPEAFNNEFKRLHAFENKKTAMEGMGVFDDQGRVPEIPRSHWWFWPIEEGAGS